MNCILTDREEIVLKSLDHAAENGLALPSLRWLADRLKHSSVSTAHMLMRSLERKGYIRIMRVGGRTSQIKIIATGKIASTEDKRPGDRANTVKHKQTRDLTTPEAEARGNLLDAVLHEGKNLRYYPLFRWRVAHNRCHAELSAL